jgi:cytochrome c
MAYECKIYDKNGKLKKILRGNQLISKTDQNFFNQPSTKKAMEFVKKLKEPKKEADHETKFYDKQCVVCSQEFHPRHQNSKYCSHECQKKLYLKKKNEGITKAKKNSN